MLGAVDHETGVHLSQVEVDTKTNEIKAIEPLLDQLDIKGKVITADALLTQVAISKYLVEKRQADFVLTVKDNQRTLKSDIAALNFKERPCDFEMIDKGHGRLEIRKIWTSIELNDYVNFPYVSQVFCIERKITQLKKETTTIETVYGITSQSQEKASPEKILNQNRKHWSIENKIHWVLDVTFNEDHSQIRCLNGPMIMTCLRRFAISFLRIHQIKNIAEAFRNLWAKPHQAFNTLIAF